MPAFSDYTNTYTKRLLTTSPINSPTITVIYSPIVQGPSHSKPPERPIDQATLAMLADIEAERDYYSTCGGW